MSLRSVIEEAGLADSWYMSDGVTEATPEAIGELLVPASSSDNEIGVSFSLTGRLGAQTSLTLRTSCIGTRMTHERNQSNPTVLDSEGASVVFSGTRSQTPPMRLFSMPSLLQFFRRSITAWEGCYRAIVGSYKLSDRTGELVRRELPLDYDSRYVPSFFSWLTYYGPTITQNLGGLDAIGSALHDYIVEPLAGGVLICATNEPFDYKNEEHINRVLAIPRLLDFASLYRKYPWPRPENRLPPPTYERIAHIDQAEKSLAEQFRKRISDTLRVVLEYTPSDVQRIDDWITQGVLPGAVSGEHVPEEWIGAFFGEVLVREFGGHWTKMPFREEAIVAILSKGILIRPIDKVASRLRNGQVDSLPYLYQVVRQQVQAAND